MLKEKLKTCNIILASGSPRRQQFFKEMDLDYTIRLKEIEEITGLSNGSIKTGLMRARNNLYSVLTERMAFKTQHDYGN